MVNWILIGFLSLWTMIESRQNVKNRKALADLKRPNREANQVDAMPNEDPVVEAIHEAFPHDSQEGRFIMPLGSVLPIIGVILNGFILGFIDQDVWALFGVLFIIFTASFYLLLNR